jgi:hypothetical protein
MCCAELASTASDILLEDEMEVGRTVRLPRTQLCHSDEDDASWLGLWPSEERLTFGGVAKIFLV